jgi:hypothetical protein
VHQRGIGRRRFEKLALSALRLGLAGVLAALGFGLLFLPQVAEQFARGRYSLRFRILLGAFHLAGGIAFLLPQVAERIAVVLGLSVAGVAVYLLAEGAGVITVEPALLAFVIFLFGGWLQFRNRAQVIAWREMLARYADQEDARYSERA